MFYAYPIKMVNVDMDKDSVETSENLFANWLKSSREWNVRCHRENVLIVDLKSNSEFKGLKIFIRYMFTLINSKERTSNTTNCLIHELMLLTLLVSLTAY